MLTRAGFALLSATVLILIAGIPTGNLYLVTLAVLPFTFFLLSALGATPRAVDVTLRLPARAIRVGETIPVTVSYRVRGGNGLFEIHQPIPSIFTLEEGNNLHVVTKGPSDATGRFRFEVRCTRRGHFAFEPAHWEMAPALGLSEGKSGTAGETQWIDVRPTLTSFRRVMRKSGRANRFFPDNDDARLGVQTTEFRDIREYVRGDPPRTINWKATARIASRAGHRPGSAPRTQGGQRHQPPIRTRPLVNEYEHEGRKTVWIYVDCAPYMRVGTSAENAFEVALEAASGSAHHFIERGYRVGFTLFNRPEPLHLYPEVGRRQLLQVQTALAAAEPTDTRGEFPRAVEETRRFLLMGRSMVIVITRADVADETTLAALRRLRGLTGSRRRRAPVIVASPDPFSLLPETHEGTPGARLIVRTRHQENLDAVRRLGLTVLFWDPRKVRFEQLLIQGGARR